VEEKIKEAIEKVRPYLQRDGGDIKFVAYTPEKVVQVQLQGACHGCPHAQMTIKQGVERILREEIPEIEAVEAV
jgi:Fe-S cluster biogenesis protein NfuA